MPPSKPPRRPVPHVGPPPVQRTVGRSPVFAPFSLPPPPSLPQFSRSEVPTKPKNVTASIYQGLLEVFDLMSQEQRMGFTELASNYSTLGEDDRRSLADLVRVLPTLSPDDRHELLELAVRFALGR